MSSSTPAPQPVRPCLLLVDDTPSNIDILVGLLKTDYDLKIATRGDRALKICEASPSIDLILLDVMMPGIDGFEVCRQLRAQPGTQQIPILFLTAKSEADDIVRGFEAGGNDYLTKPFRPEELQARVRTQLTLLAQRKEIERQNTDLKEMLHIICHDVANHFTVLNMSLQLGEANPARDLPNFLPHMKAAVKHGIDLTELVRDMRRSEDKGISLQPVRLQEAVKESLLLLEGQLNSKDVRTEVDVAPVTVLAEPCALINSVLNNILTNAIKFSPRGERIEIQAVQDAEGVLLRICDHGIGMPQSIVEKLFDVGRSHSRRGTAGERGTGFGMPLMWRFVRQFGGSVEVVTREASPEAPDAHGTEFRIRLRLAP